MRLAQWFGLTALVLTVLAMVVPSTAAEKGASLWHRNLGEAWKATQSGTRPMLLFVTMDGCTYCQKMKYETYADDGVMATLKRSFVAAAAEAENNPGLIRRFNIESYPTTMIFAPNGKVLDSIVGYIGPEQMQRRLQAVVPNRQTKHQPVSTNN